MSHPEEHVNAQSLKKTAKIINKACITYACQSATRMFHKYTFCNYTFISTKLQWPNYDKQKKKLKSDSTKNASSGYQPVNHTLQ